MNQLRKIYIKDHNDSGFSHRSGWPYATSFLKKLHTNHGILFESFIEKKFVWGPNLGEGRNNPKSYLEPWVGVFHVPEQVPEWFNNKQIPKEIFQNKYFLESLPFCLGFYCLSEYEKKIIKKYTDLPINVLFHPTETPEIKFSFEKFLANQDREVIQLGTFLRKFSSIFILPVTKIKKSALGMGTYAFYQLKREKIKLGLHFEIKGVKIYKFLKGKKYDEVLSQNIAFMNLYDASANNAVIECIVRNTPLLINPLPAVVEYLGPNYPFYFNTLVEAAQKAENIDLIKETHEYLKNLKTKERLTGEAFVQSLANSQIYHSLEIQKLGMRTILKRISQEYLFHIFNYSKNNFRRIIKYLSPKIYYRLKKIILKEN